MDIKKVKKLLENETNVKFKNLIEICTFYFDRPRVRGSHHIFKTPWKGLPWLNLQKDGKMAKKYQVKQVREALIKLKGY